MPANGVSAEKRVNLLGRSLKSPLMVLEPAEKRVNLLGRSLKSPLMSWNLAVE